jgi:DNA-directed RNA polymerase specialized sigma24 family protein
VNTLKFTIRNMRRSRESGQQLLSRYLALQTEAITYSTDAVSLEVLYEDMAHSEEFKLVKEMAVDGKSHLQMAEARGITVAACKKRMERAKKLLQKKL